MSLTTQEQDYYARKFQEELNRIDKNNTNVRAQSTDSFMVVLKDVVSRVAPHLWDTMKDVWEAMFQRWIRNPN